MLWEMGATPSFPLRGTTVQWRRNSTVDNTSSVFECPITRQIIKDPVVDPDGHSYERNAIEKWVRDFGTSPLTRKTLSLNMLTPNRKLKDAIDFFRTCAMPQTIKESDVQLRGKRLGQGSHAIVHAGTWLGKPVAIKTLLFNTHESIRQRARRSFEIEISMLFSLRHPNVLDLYGFYSSADGTLSMVLEMGHSSLTDFLMRSAHREDSEQPKPINFRTAFDIALDITHGLSFLHTREHPVAHCDLKSPNIILFSTGRAKIADFGIARCLKEAMVAASTNSSCTLGAIGWMAPENGDESSEHYGRPASDIYSLGMILWELAVGTGAQPWQGLGVFHIVRAISNRERPVIPQRTPLELSALIQKCWIHEPMARPSIGEVLVNLNILQASLPREETRQIQLSVSSQGFESAESGSAGSNTRISESSLQNSVIGSIQGFGASNANNFATSPNPPLALPFGPTVGSSLPPPFVFGTASVPAAASSSRFSFSAATTGAFSGFGAAVPSAGFGFGSGSTVPTAFFGGMPSAPVAERLSVAFGTLQVGSGGGGVAGGVFGGAAGGVPFGGADAVGFSSAAAAVSQANIGITQQQLPVSLGMGTSSTNLGSIFDLAANTISGAARMPQVS